MHQACRGPGRAPARPRPRKPARRRRMHLSLTSLRAAACRGGRSRVPRQRSLGKSERRQREWRLQASYVSHVILHTRFDPVSSLGLINFLLRGRGIRDGLSMNTAADARPGRRRKQFVSSGYRLEQGDQAEQRWFLAHDAQPCSLNHRQDVLIVDAALSTKLRGRAC